MEKTEGEERMEMRYCPYCMSPVEPDAACPNCGLTSGAYSPAAHHLPPGTVLKERYIVGRVLGEGGFGITYIGCDMRLELRVAIKEYFPTDKANRISAASLSVSSYFGVIGDRYAEGKVRFLQEARTMARMDKQPVIVSVRDFFEANNTAYIVMEYVDGTTFKELVDQKGGRIPAGELLYTIEPLFYALSAMHERKLIHRDISPENLMLENGEIRLLDFGCAREAQSGDATLTIALKHGYAPVEQYQNKGQGPWTDVYALSATIYYCLTGRRPPQSMDRLVEDELIPPRKLGVDLTEKQEKALLYGMGVGPRRRFQSVQEMHTALYEGVVLSHGIHSVRGEAGQMQSPVSISHSGHVESDATVPIGSTGTPAGGGGNADVSNAESGGKAEEKKPGWLKKNKALAGGIAALLVVAVGLGIWVSTKNATKPEPVIAVTATATATAIPTATPAPTPQPTATPEPDPFASAARLDGNDEQVFRAFMSSEQIEAVIIPSGSLLNLEDGPLEVTKPLLIEEGAQVNDRQPITVSGEGFLSIEGDLWIDGLLRLTGGGSVSVASSGNLSGSAAVWMEHEEQLAVEDGGRCNMYAIDYGSERSGERFIVFNEEEVFAGATHVNSYEEWQAAIGDAQTKAIVIDESFTISDIARLHAVPVLISEGVTVTAPHFLPDRNWLCENTVLINHGTLRGAFQTGSWNDDSVNGVCTIINDGLFDATLFIDASGAFINLGTVNLWDSQMYAANFHNLGTMTVDPRSDFVDVCCATFHNSGEIIAEDESYQPLEIMRVFRTGNGIRFFNTGVMRFGRGGDLENGGYLDNAGQILFTDANSWLDNLGHICNTARGSVLEVCEEATWNDAGFIQYGHDTPARLSENVEEGGGHQLAFRWGDTTQTGIVYVSTETGLREMLASDEYELVVVKEGCQITVTGDLTITKGVAIPAGSSLKLQGGGLTISGENAYLVVDRIDLGGGALRLENEAILVIGNDGCYNCGGISMDGHSRMVNEARLDIASGATVELNGNSHLLNLGHLSLERVALRVNNGVLRSTSWLELQGCQVEIGRSGELLTNYSSFIVDEATELVNKGKLSLNNNGMFQTELNGALLNEISTSRMELNASEIRLGGSLVNKGKIMVDGLTVTGTVQNNGMVWYLPDSLTIDGGTWNGAQPKQVDEWVSP